MTGWPGVVAWVATVPPAVWVAVIVTLVVASWSLAARRMRRAGQRLGAPPGRPRDTVLTLASLVPAGLFWLMVLGGSLHGLVAFGRTTLGWRDGWEYLVPGTLDGVSVAFAMLAFRAIRRSRPPDRCYRVVWGAALASATINFAHEYGQTRNALAGGYLALLSLFGMVMFDEFLNQFEDGADRVRRENPKFGVRWLTWPTNTFLAAVAWRNHPPAEGTHGTVANAVANLHRVRAAKRVARRGRRPTDSVRPAQDHTVQHRPSRTRTKPRPVGDARVPNSAAAVARWLGIWVTLCRQPDVARACFQDADVARAHFGISDRQLRNVRHAAKSGALRRRADELDVALPDDFHDG